MIHLCPKSTLGVFFTFDLTRAIAPAVKISNVVVAVKGLEYAFLDKDLPLSKESV